MILRNLDNDPNDGTCRICGNSFTYQGMTRHLKRCIGQHAVPRDSSQWLHIRLRLWAIATNSHWVHVLVDPMESLQSLDAYLRQIWCRDHDGLSEFDLTRTIYASDLEKIGDRKYPVESMDRRIETVIQKGTEIRHSYEVGAERSMVTGKVYGRSPVPELEPENNPVPGVMTVAYEHEVNSSA